MNHVKKTCRNCAKLERQTINAPIPCLCTYDKRDPHHVIDTEMNCKGWAPKNVKKYIKEAFGVKIKKETDWENPYKAYEL